MLRSLKGIEKFEVSATDGDIGHVVNFLLDDQHWTVRYLVVETGTFFNSKPVLISPISFGTVDWDAKRFRVALTREKVRDSPSIDVDQPVTRQHESRYYGYYQYPYYWGYAGVWGVGMEPGLLAVSAARETATAAVTTGDTHLRSESDVRGYHVQGTDDEIGHIDDFVIDDGTWQVRYLAVDTSNWWMGKTVLVPPSWATKVSWEERKVFVAVRRQQIKDSPVWDSGKVISRGYEERLHDFYARPGYWAVPVQVPPKAEASKPAPRSAL